jgi:hypothetical protein
VRDEKPARGVVAETDREPTMGDVNVPPRELPDMPCYQHVPPLSLLVVAGRSDLTREKVGLIPLATREEINVACRGEVSGNVPVSYALLQTSKLRSMLTPASGTDEVLSCVNDAVLIARDGLIRTTFKLRRRCEMTGGDAERFARSGGVLELDIGTSEASALAVAVQADWTHLEGGFSSYAVVDGARKRVYCKDQALRTRTVPTTLEGSLQSERLAAALAEKLKKEHPNKLGKLTCLVCYAVKQDHAGATTFARHIDGEIENVRTLPKYTVTIMIEGPRLSSALHVFGEKDSAWGPVLRAYKQEGCGFLFPSECPHATVPGLTAYLKPPGVMKLSLQFGDCSETEVADAASGSSAGHRDAPADGPRTKETTPERTGVAALTEKRKAEVELRMETVGSVAGSVALKVAAEQLTRLSAPKK